MDGWKDGGIKRWTDGHTNRPLNTEYTNRPLNEYFTSGR